MNKDNLSPFEIRPKPELVKYYEEMMDNNDQYFYDVDEFEEIIDYYFEQNELVKASRAIEMSKKQHPDSIALQLKTALLYINQSKPQKALPILNTIQKMALQKEEVYVLKAHAYNLMKNDQKAMSYFDKTLKCTQDSDKEEMLTRIGYSFQQRGKYQQAIKYFNMAFERNPSSTDHIFNIAICYEELQDTTNSIVFLQKYLDIDPFSEIIWFKLGKTFELQNEYEKAIEAYDYSLAIEESFAHVYLSKGTLLMSIGEYQQAIRTFEALLEIEDDFIEAYCFIGECFSQMDKKNKAIRYFFKALHIDNEYSEAWFNIGNIKLEQEKFKESIHYLKKAKIFEPDNAEYWFTLAEAYAAHGDYVNTRKAYQKALFFDPYCEEYWCKYAQYLFNRGHIDKAINVIEKAGEYHFNSNNLLFYLAGFYLTKKDIQTGITLLETALMSNPLQHMVLYDICPKIMDNEEVTNLIEHHINTLKYI